MSHWSRLKLPSLLTDKLGARFFFFDKIENDEACSFFFFFLVQLPFLVKFFWVSFGFVLESFITLKSFFS